MRFVGKLGAAEDRRCGRRPRKLPEGRIAEHLRELHEAPDEATKQLANAFMAAHKHDAESCHVWRDV